MAPNTQLPAVRRAADKPMGERFVMCPPQYLSTAIPNNVFMKGAKVDVPRAMEQYARVKAVVQAFGVDVLEIPPGKGLQDQWYVANVACFIEPYVVMANYKAPGRAGEVPVAQHFFESLGYQCIQPPFHFEGEADLKKVGPGAYIGGYGKFTDIRALHWIAQKTGATILPVEEVSDELYHLDCSLFVLDDQHLLVTPKGLSPASVKALGKVANLVVTPRGSEMEATGITNGVKIPGKGIYLSGAFNPEHSEYRKAMDWMNKTFDNFGYVPLFVDVDAALPSGGDLSCTVCHADFLPKRLVHQPAAAPAGPPAVGGGDIIAKLASAIRPQPTAIRGRS